MDPTATEAIARLKRGDISGLADLVERYQVQAVRTAFLITHDRAMAEDVVQAAFLRVYRHIGQFDSTRPFAPWFLRIVVNAAVQAAQKQQRQFSLDGSPHAAWDDFADSTTFADMLPDPQPGPDAEIEAAELRQAVWEALAALSPEQRAAIVMRYYLGLSESEMADQMDSPPGTIKWRLHAARNQLRFLLRPFGKPLPEEV